MSSFHKPLPVFRKSWGKLSEKRRIECFLKKYKYGKEISFFIPLSLCIYILISQKVYVNDYIHKLFFNKCFKFYLIKYNLIWIKHILFILLLAWKMFLFFFNKKQIFTSWACWEFKSSSFFPYYYIK